MASIHTAIQLNDNFTNVVNNIVAATNIMVATMSEMNQSMNTDIDTSRLEGVRDCMNQATIAAGQLNSAIKNIDPQSPAQEQEQFNQKIQQGTNEAGRLASTIKSAIGAYATIQTVKNVLNASDELVQTTARLDLMNDGVQTTHDLVNMVYVAAQDARGSFGDMADIVARFGNNAKDAFSSSAEVVQFSGLIQKQMKIAGASTQEAVNAELQLSQALGSGVLRGDELNSIFEQAPNLIQNIADYLNVPIGKVREMASEGELTADVVKQAIFSAADDINAKFEAMPMTWGDIWQHMQNAALMAFQPVLQEINEIPNNADFQAFIDTAINEMAALAGVALDVFQLAASAGGFVVDHWSIIAPLIMGVVTAMLIYNGVLFAYNALQAVTNGLQAISAARAAIKAGATLAEAAATTTAAGAQVGFNAALLACPVTWIVLGIIALIAVLFAASNAIAKVTGAAQTGFGIICGGVLTAGAFILNTIIGLINAAIQLLWTRFVEPFIGIVEWVLNVANGGFNSFGDAVANLIGQIISWFLSLGKVVTRIIDAIFGTNWTAGLSSLQNQVISWGKNENAITLSRTAPSINYRASYGSAFKTGSAWGDGVANKVGDKIGNIFSGKATEVPEQNDYANALADANSGVTKNTGDTAKNTSNISKQLEITNEDLKYIRDIAERDIINRYTTASITVNQTNHNNIRNDMDLDGVTEHLRLTVEEQMNAAAEGVH